MSECAAESLDIVPAQLRVKVIRRPRYGCRACEEAVVQAPAPERPTTGGVGPAARAAAGRGGGRAGEGGVGRGPAPERPITGGMATEALLAQVLVAKYADFLPLYRQAQIFARQGVEPDRPTLCARLGRA